MLLIVNCFDCFTSLLHATQFSSNLWHQTTLIIMELLCTHLHTQSWLVCLTTPILAPKLIFVGRQNRELPHPPGVWGGEVFSREHLALKGLTERGLYLRHNDWQIWITIVDQWISCGTKPTFISVIFVCWVGDYLGEGGGRLIHDHITVTHTVKKTFDRSCMCSPQFYTQNKPMCCLQFLMLILPVTISRTVNFVDSWYRNICTRIFIGISCVDSCYQ